MLTIREALRNARERLADAGIADTAVEAEVLLMSVLGVGRAFLYTHPECPLSLTQEQCFEQMLARRLFREPSAYIIGEREFFGRSFLVDHRVLIPRPETEILVETALDRLRREFGHAPVVADVGTGSGAIAVSLALAHPDVLVYAIDISSDALAVAAANAARHGVAGRVRFLQGDLLTPLPEPVDLIVTNLPYIPTGEIAGLEPEVRAHEPFLALAGGTTGLDLIRRLLEQAPQHLRPGGTVALEIGAGQAPAVAALAHAQFPSASIRTIPDLAGHHRVVVVS